MTSTTQQFAHEVSDNEGTATPFIVVETVMSAAQSRSKKVHSHRLERKPKVTLALRQPAEMDSVAVRVALLPTSSHA